MARSRRSCPRRPDTYCCRRARRHPLIPITHQFCWSRLADKTVLISHRGTSETAAAAAMPGQSTPAKVTQYAEQGGVYLGPRHSLPCRRTARPRYPGSLVHGRHVTPTQVNIIPDSLSHRARSASVADGHYETRQTISKPGGAILGRHCGVWVHGGNRRLARRAAAGSA